MDIHIFDNFDEDGQLTLFGLEEDIEELQSAKKRTMSAGKQAAEEQASGKPAAEEQVPGKQASEESVSGEQTAGEQLTGQQPSDQGSVGIRIRRCSSCGKLLFVREEDGGYSSACNACGIQYVQK